MQFGRSYEEFEVGATYKHWPGKTVTEYDDHLFCLLTMNHHPLHLDANYAEKTTQFGKNVVVGNYIYSLLLGMSVPDVSGKAIANLEVESLRHVAPTFHGDTIYGETDGARQVGVEVQGRPRRRLRRDQRLQPGRHGGLHLPAQGDGAQGQSYLEARGGEQPGRPVPARRSRAELTVSRPRQRRRGVAGPPRRDRVEPRRPAHLRRPTSTSPTPASRSRGRWRSGSPGTSFDLVLSQSTAAGASYRGAGRLRRRRGRRRPASSGPTATTRASTTPEIREDGARLVGLDRSRRPAARPPSRSRSGSTGWSTGRATSTSGCWCSGTATRCGRWRPAGSSSRSPRGGSSSSTPRRSSMLGYDRDFPVVAALELLRSRPTRCSVLDQPAACRQGQSSTSRRGEPADVGGVVAGGRSGSTRARPRCRRSPIT